MSAHSFCFLYGILCYRYCYFSFGLFYLQLRFCFSLSFASVVGSLHGPRPRFRLFSRLICFLTVGSVQYSYLLIQKVFHLCARMAGCTLLARLLQFSTMYDLIKDAHTCLGAYGGCALTAADVLLQHGSGWASFRFVWLRLPYS